MAWNDRQINIIHDLASGSSILDSDAKTSASLARFPETYYAGDSFTLNLSIYNNYSIQELADFGSGATATLYLKLYNGSDTPTSLATGTVSQASGETEYSEVSFTVAEDATADYEGLSCLLYAVIEDATASGKLTVSQTLNVASLSGTGTGNLPAYLMSYTPSTSSDWTTEPDDVAEALDQLADRLTDAEADIDTNTSAIATNATDIATNETDIAALDTRLTTAENDLNTAEGDIATNETDIAALQASLAALTGTTQQTITLSGASQTSKLWTITSANPNGYIATCADEELASGIMAYCTDSTAGTCLVHGTFSRSGNEGAILYLSTGGSIVEWQPTTSGYYIRPVGYQLTSSVAYLCPSIGWGTVA